MDSRWLRRALVQSFAIQPLRRNFGVVWDAWRSSGLLGAGRVLVESTAQLVSRLRGGAKDCRIFSPAQAADRRILFVEARMIVPEHDSGSERLFRLMALTRDLGHDVVFVPADRDFNPQGVKRLRERGIVVPEPEQVPSLESFLAWYGSGFGAVVLCRADVADWLLPQVRICAPHALLVFDTVDLHFLRERRAANLLRRPGSLRAARKRREQELRLVREADVTWVVSQTERDKLAELVPGADVRLVSNVHSVHSVTTPFSGRADLVFVGGFEHHPNVDAVLYYSREIVPPLRRLLPEVTTHIVGAHPPAEILQLHSKQLRVHGFVPELRPFLETCRASVAPLRYGAGVKGKVNLSMSWGLPVVATSIAAEGAHLSDGVDVMIADDPGEFAEKTARVYQDPELWARLSDGGRLNIERHFSPAVASRAIQNTFGMIGVRRRRRGSLS